MIYKETQTHDTNIAGKTVLRYQVHCDKFVTLMLMLEQLARIFYASGASK